jgi:hypothetical protein
MSHSVKHSFATVLASLLCAAVIAMAVRAFASPIAFGQKPAPAKATEGLPPGPLQAKATTSCLECH